MEKVQLPKVEEETRADLNVLKANRKDKTLDATLKYLLSLEEKNQFLEKRCTLKEDDFNELLKMRTFTQDEMKAIDDLTRDIDLCDAECEEYTELIKSVRVKLIRMIE